MSQLRSFTALTTLLGALAAIPAIAFAQSSQTTRTPVLVELFTSEGCSSCPPADALLARLDRDQPIAGAQIIVLSEHVDYWDGQGWHDRFSSHQYTDRQTQYAERLRVDSPYTPQMIVDGTDQFVGSDVSHARRSIEHAAQTTRIKLTLSQPVVSGHKVSASISIPASTTAPPKGDLYAALVDPTDTTEVRGGENDGRRLQHAGVVRSLQRVGSLKEIGTKPLSFTLTAPPDSKPGEMRVVVFAQAGQGAILGAAQETVRGTAPDAVAALAR
ncbi:MAG: DUF1223 domain-containing protein [Edaphobacter sp.]